MGRGGAGRAAAERQRRREDRAARARRREAPRLPLQGKRARACRQRAGLGRAVRPCACPPARTATEPSALAPSLTRAPHAPPPASPVPRTSTQALADRVGVRCALTSSATARGAHSHHAWVLVRLDKGAEQRGGSGGAGSGAEPGGVCEYVVDLLHEEGALYAEVRTRMRWPCCHPPRPALLRIPRASRAHTHPQPRCALPSGLGRGGAIQAAGRLLPRLARLACTRVDDTRRAARARRLTRSEL